MLEILLLICLFFIFKKLVKSSTLEDVKLPFQQTTGIKSLDFTKLTDKEIFEFVCSNLKTPPLIIWEEIINRSGADQSFNEFDETGKIDFKLRGHLNFMAYDAIELIQT